MRVGPRDSTRPPRRRVFPPVLAACLLAVSVAVPERSPVSAAARSDPASRLELRRRAAQLFEKRERAREDTGIAPAPLRAELRALGDSLDAAGLDTLAAQAFYKAGGIGIRLRPRSGVDADLRRAIRSALRARSTRDELSAISLLTEVLSDEDPEAAARYLESQLPRFRQAGSRSERGDAYGRLARCYSLMGRWPRATAYARRGVQELAPEGDSRALAYVLTQYSQHLVIAKRFAEGLAMADSAAAVAGRLGAGLQASRALVARSSALRRLGRTEESVAALRAAIALDAARDDRVHEQQSRLTLANRCFEAGNPGGALAQLDTIEARSGTGINDFTRLKLVQYRAAALRGLGRHRDLDALLAGKSFRIDAVEPSADAEENRAGANTIAAQIWLEWMLSCMDRGEPERAFELQGRSRGRLFDADIGAAPPSLAELQRRLGRQRAALLAFEGAPGDSGLAFLVTPDFLAAERFGYNATLADAESFRAALLAGGGDRAVAATGERLARGLLGSLRARLPREAERLVVIPLALASDLPIEALPLGGERGGSIGERYAVHTAPSTASWMAFADRAPATGAPAAFADPVPGRTTAAREIVAGLARAGLGWRLPRAVDEARAAAGAEGRVHLGRAASGERLREELGRASVVHVAAHGLVLPEDPSRSGILLSEPAGLVTPAEISELRVAADLVVLSACHGDRGPAYPGEGRLGFARALLRAGARSVLATRWELGDRAAAVLMRSFYAGLRRGLPRDECLRRARVEGAGAGLPARDLHAFVLHGAGGLPLVAAATEPGGR